MSSFVETLRESAVVLLGERNRTYAFAAAVATIAIAATARRLLISSSPPSDTARGPLPPCPPAWPLVGHLPLLATASEPDKLIQRLAREYGPIFHLKLGNVIAVIISSNELAQETLVKRGKTYASRRAGKVAALSTDNAQNMAQIIYGPRWSHLRRVAHRILTPLKLTDMDAILAAESLRFVQHLLAKTGEPVEIKQYLMLYTANIMLAKCLGITHDSPDDPALESLCADVHTMFQIAGVGGIEDYFDSMLVEWAGMSHKRKIIAAVCERVHRGLIWNRLVEFKARLDGEKARGVDPRSNRNLCWAEELILFMNEDELTLNDIKLLMLDFIFAGIDTTAATLLWVFIYLINDPTLQTRLHAEVDAIVATHGRLPSLDDLDALPYTRAIIKEVTRLSPVAPLGLPRQTIEDDALAGYHIPAGAQVIYNVVGIHSAMDDGEFRPDRWIERGSLTVMDGTLTFGAGRRMCPGVHLATREMVLLVARTVACVGLGNAKGDGAKIEMTSQFGLTVLPKETVLVQAAVRDPRVRDLVEKVGALVERFESDQEAVKVAE
ncbi:hypothetical protein AMAG_13145 [Allomyces macrogynus ATCC 38327]|uniref:Cytochrome P450 n=1 Tax=Allomyces macrogynus (strain ATCC 38327) TaxID=578462 RepID=A0A0L0SZP9_ALLM3|nr:hypothetical protein AMAG_13145 [Allomyces macrogynus ATCC 38327]|eukprot:KNE67967.1 hypothetical protein AMAG_13145 [Allomyces macrogynus ATCC 38327]